MSATAETIARGTVTDSLVSRFGEIFNPKDGFLAAYNVEREEQIELAGVSLLSGIDPLFLGDPGVGKTWLIELMLRCLEGADERDFFNTLVFKETPADDILGPRSLPAMKEGRIERMTSGYLPDSTIAYLDEIFKASPTLTNSILDIMAQRKLKVGATVLSTEQLLCIFFSSNELPEREDQQPMRDRIGLTNFVPPVRSPEGRKRVMKIQDAYQANARAVDMGDAPTLSLDAIRTMRTEVRGIEIPDAVFEAMDKAQERWGQAGHPPSQRRVGQMLMALKARAWSRGEGCVTTDDMILTAHMAWNHPDHADSAREIVMEFANEYTRKANRMRQALEPLLAEVDQVKSALDAAGGDEKAVEEAMEKGYPTMRQLRKLKKESADQIHRGEQQGHDTSDLKKVQGDVEQARSWIEKALMGEDSSTGNANPDAPEA